MRAGSPPNSLRCKFKLLWNLREKRLEEILDDDGANCLELSSLPLPFTEASEGTSWHRLLSSGYTYANVLGIHASKAETARLSRVCGLEESSSNSPCNHLAVSEDEFLQATPAAAIERVAEIARKAGAESLFLLAGYREEPFYSFFGKEGTTLLTFLFREGLLDELIRDYRLSVVTRGLITSNDVKVILESGIGLIYCFDPRAPSHVIPFDEILREGGRVYLSHCRAEEVFNGFLLGEVVRSIHSYYRKRKVLTDEEVLEMLYAWWERVLPSVLYPPDSLIYYGAIPPTSEGRVLLGLAELGRPDRVELRL